MVNGVCVRGVGGHVVLSESLSLAFVFQHVKVLALDIIMQKLFKFEGLGSRLKFSQKSLKIPKG
jgi:hypothetical protein